MKYYFQLDGENWHTDQPTGLSKTDFNIWLRQFSIKELQTLSMSCGNLDPIPDILDWSSVSKAMVEIKNDNVEVILQSYSELCGSSSANE